MLRLLDDPLLVELHLLTVDAVAAALEVEVWSREWHDDWDSCEVSVEVVRAAKSEVGSLADFWLVVLAHTAPSHVSHERILAGARNGLFKPGSMEELFELFRICSGVRSPPEWPAKEAIEGVRTMFHEWNEQTMIFSTEDEHWCVTWLTTA